MKTQFIRSNISIFNPLLLKKVCPSIITILPADIIRSQFFLALSAPISYCYDITIKGINPKLGYFPLCDIL